MPEPDRPRSPDDGAAAASGREHASILDVASRAGVSPSTVSRSLRGLPHVSEATRRKVTSAARELSYVASPTASGLASGRTTTVGVVVPFMTRWFFAQALAAACQVLQSAGYDVLLHHIGGAQAREQFFERMPLARRVDAVLVLGLPLSDERRFALQELGLPLVVVGARIPGVTCVRIDDVDGASRAVNHLLHQGHEDIAMIAALDDYHDASRCHARRQGYRDALAAAGLPHRDQAMVTRTYGVEGGAEAMEQLLSGGALPTAVFGEYDELAIGALRTLTRAGMSVPKDLSLVGFDDHEMAAVVDLTTVAQPVQEQGGVAARLLLDTLAGRLAEPADVVLPTRLVIRGSTGRPPARQRRPASRA